MIGFELSRPGLAWLLALVPLALLAGGLALSRSRAELARWVVERRRERVLPGFSPTRAHLRVWAGAAGLGFLALAALGPVRGHTYRAVARKGLDLVVCLDTSRSMLAQDLRPSRLERAKREVRGLLDHLTGDRVALVAFSGDARDVAPLTRDRGTLVRLLAHVSPEDNQEGGTDLAAAIERALALFDGRTGAHEAIVLLTDGEDLEGRAEAQAEEAARRGIRLFVVGVGTEAGGKIPVADADGRSAFLRGPDGQEVVSRLGRESLATLAARTGGEFLSAEQAPTALEDLYRARISRIQGREIEGGERRVPYDRYQWPLALGLACLVLELGLRARAGRDDGARLVARQLAAWLPLLGLSGQEPASLASALASAVRHHRAGEPAAAQAEVEAALARADELGLSELGRARAHYALGVITATRVLESEEEGEPLRAAATEAFAAARALAGPGALRLDATYDLGTLELFLAERARARIPEISGAAAAPAPPPAATGGVPAPPSDPLAEARALYLAAKAWLLERLRLDWRDEDTRANLELVQRRLKELDQLERERQEQQRQDPQQDPEAKDQDQPKDQDESKGEDGQKDQGEPEDPQGKEGERDPEQEGEDEGQPQQDGASQDPEGGAEQEQLPQPSEPREGEEASQEEGPKASEEPAERVLTREEVIQLLDRLAELEQQQKALEAALRARRRAAAERDW